VSARSTRLEEWCPDWRATPGTRCATCRLTPRKAPSSVRHVARAWRGRSCPTCRALPGEACRTPSGPEAASPHKARLRRGRGELTRDNVRAELERRAVRLAPVPLSGRAGAGGGSRTTLLSLLGGRSVEIWRSEWQEELADALEAPVADRCGAFAGRAPISGTVTWSPRSTKRSHVHTLWPIATSAVRARMRSRRRWPATPYS
jgi:hypothetical protein